MLLPPSTNLWWMEHVYDSIMARQPFLRLRHSAVPLRLASRCTCHSSDLVLKTKKLLNRMGLGWVVLTRNIIVTNIFRHLLCALISEKRKTEALGG